MKKLLGIVVLGLGLMLNISSKAEATIIPKGYCEAPGGWVPCDDEIKKLRNEAIKQKEKEKEAKLDKLKYQSEKLLKNLNIILRSYDISLNELNDKIIELKDLFIEYENIFNIANEKTENAILSVADNKNIKKIKEKIKIVNENKNKFLNVAIYNKLENDIDEIKSQTYKKNIDHVRLIKLLKDIKALSKKITYSGNSYSDMKKMTKMLKKMTYIYKKHDIKLKSQTPYEKPYEKKIKEILDLKNNIEIKIKNINENIDMPIKNLLIANKKLNKNKFFIKLIKSNPIYWIYNLINALVFDNI